MAFEELKKVRLEKLERLKKAGLNVFPEKAAFGLSEIAGIKKDFRRYARSKKSPGMGGRILAKREHGGSIFVDLFDGSAKLQAFFAKDKVGGESFKLFSENIDIGDFIAVSGRAFYTKKKEPTLEVSRWQILAKALRPLPEKWHGLSDVEERFRRRYLDILMNEKAKERFIVRSKIIREFRSALDKENFIEVETPILQNIAGGALARPFATHHNALNLDLYLRIAPELYLKRLLVGGLERVYEIGKVFRNEGIDHSHNPEYTLLEFYAAYWEEEKMMEFVEKIFLAITKKILGKKPLQKEGKKIVLNKKFPRISFREILKRHAFVLEYDKETESSLKLKAQQFGLEVAEHMSKGKIADEIFDKVCRPKLLHPTFVTELPLDISPLAKGLNKDFVRRFNLIVGGNEIADGWAELNDPVEQSRRLEEHEKLRKAGEEEAHRFDDEFIEAMEYGMPPTAGVGIGIDRLVMLLTDTPNIKEVILFPTLKPKE